MTWQQLVKAMPILPDECAKEYIEPLVAAMVEFDITTLERKAMFLAQVGHESYSLTRWVETGEHAGKQYEGRHDLGNTHPGDGERYKGRGPIQLTGRYNYRRYGKLLGVDLEASPELAASPEYGFRVAGLYWKINNLNAWSDKGDVVAVTRRVNGKLNGLANRESRYRLALKALEN